MSHANRVAQEACAMIATRALAGASGVKDPDAYYGRILGQTRSEHFDAFMALLDERPGMSAEALVATVDEGRQETGTEVLNTSSRLPTYSSDDLDPPSEQDRMTAHSGLGRAREALREARKP